MVPSRGSLEPVVGEALSRRKSRLFVRITEPSLVTWCHAWWHLSSKVGGTPTVPQGQQLSLKPIPREWIERITLYNILAPKDPMKTQSMMQVEVITVPQAAPTTSPKIAGKTDHQMVKLSTYYFYSNNTTIMPLLTVPS